MDTKIKLETIDANLDTIMDAIQVDETTCDLFAELNAELSGAEFFVEFVAAN